MIGAILFILFMAALIAFGLRARNWAYAAIEESLLDEKLGEEMTDQVEAAGGMDMVEIVGYGAMDMTNIVLGGTGLEEKQVRLLHAGYHLLCDFKCQLCEKVMPEWPEPCSPRTKEPPPLPCEYCLGDGCEECGPIGR
jgi:hypothetical protein